MSINQVSALCKHCAVHFYNTQSRLFSGTAWCRKISCFHVTQRHIKKFVESVQRYVCFSAKKDFQSMCLPWAFWKCLAGKKMKAQRKDSGIHARRVNTHFLLVPSPATRSLLEVIHPWLCIRVIYIQVCFRSYWTQSLEIGLQISVINDLQVILVSDIWKVLFLMLFFSSYRQRTKFGGEKSGKSQFKYIFNI